jgi:hypothetical protein
MKELKYFRRDEMTSVLKTTLRVRRATSSLFWLLISGSWILQKYCFLPNEPKVVQCLPGKLKKQRRAKASKTAQNPPESA